MGLLGCSPSDPPKSSVIHSRTKIVTRPNFASPNLPSVAIPYSPITGSALFFSGTFVWLHERKKEKKKNTLFISRPKSALLARSTHSNPCDAPLPDPTATAKPGLSTAPDRSSISRNLLHNIWAHRRCPDKIMAPCNQEFLKA